MNNALKFDLQTIGEDYKERVVEEAINSLDGRSAQERELDRLYLLERRLYIINNMMISGTVQGEGITRTIQYTIDDEMNRKEMEHKLMLLLNQV